MGCKHWQKSIYKFTKSKHLGKVSVLLFVCCFHVRKLIIIISTNSVYQKKKKKKKTVQECGRNSNYCQKWWSYNKVRVWHFGSLPKIARGFEI